MENKYPENIMKRCREAMGLEEDDTSRDVVINTYSPAEAFNACCNWEGLIGWGDTLLSFVEDCFGIELE